ncbi:MAG: hypothetical protein N2A40_00070, partial [Desulfobulbaceae bacterium]
RPDSTVVLPLIQCGLEEMENQEIFLGKGSKQILRISHQNYGGSVSFSLGSQTSSIASITGSWAIMSKIRSLV